MNTFVLWIYHLMTGWLPESRAFAWKRMWLRFAGAKIGRDVRIYSSARFLGNGRLEIGDDVHIGPYVMIYAVAPARVVIGNCIDIGPRVTVLTGSHEIDPVGAHIGGKGIVAEVVIGDGSWIGANATVLPGVVLAKKTVVAAGAVITRSVEGDKSLVAGVPAQIKKQY